MATGKEVGWMTKQVSPLSLPISLSLFNPRRKEGRGHFCELDCCKLSSSDPNRSDGHRHRKKRGGINNCLGRMTNSFMTGCRAVESGLYHRILICIYDESGAGAEESS